MKMKITVELGGMTFHVDEEAYFALRSYFERAEARLEGNPDQREIVADLEGSIAEKLGRIDGPQKTIGTADVVAVLQEVGGIDGEDFEHPASFDEHPAARKLYRIHDGRHLTGLCAGIAAYSGWDAAWVRTLAVFLSVFTFGLFVGVYLVMMFAVPLARTPNEIAAAHGRTARSQPRLL